MAGVFFAHPELTEDKERITQSAIAASEAAGMPIVPLDRFQKRGTIKREAPQRAAAFTTVVLEKDQATIRQDACYAMPSRFCIFSSEMPFVSGMTVNTHTSCPIMQTA